MKIAALLGVFALLAGCSSSPKCKATNGTLKLNVTGLPAGVAANVKLTATTDQVATDAGTFTFPGDTSVTVTPAPVAQADALVRKAFSGGAAQTVLVCGDDTVTVTIAYAQIPTSNRVWMGNSNGTGTLLAFSASDLGASATVTAAVVGHAAGSFPAAFDTLGNLWTTDNVERNVKRYPAASLAGSGTPSADVVLSNDLFEAGAPGLSTLAFDAQGNLWVASVVNKKLARFAPASLTATGRPMPDLTLTLPNAAKALAFDSTGNLWFTGDAPVFRIDKAHLTASFSGTPDLVLHAKSKPPVVLDLGADAALAFDASGNLWSVSSSVVFRLTPTDRSGTGDVTVTPDVQFTINVLALPENVAFDEGGGMWIAYTQGRFARLSATQLTSTAIAVVPDRLFVSTDVGSATSLAIYPAPAGLPLYSRLP